MISFKGLVYDLYRIFIDYHVFKKFCKDNDYDWNAVELLGILQYFNICTLYDNFKDGRYGNFLFLYGKYLLSKFLLRSNK